MKHIQLDKLPYLLLVLYFIKVLLIPSLGLAEALSFVSLVFLTGVYQWNVRSSEVKKLQAKVDSTLELFEVADKRMASLEGSVSSVKLGMGMRTTNVKNNTAVR